MPNRIVGQLPLTELWNEFGSLSIRRGRDVGRSEIVERLHSGPVQFVVADIGQPLNWVLKQDCHHFWKNELKPRLVEPELARSGYRLEDFPGEYCYVASEWGDDGPSPVIVLECSH
jgi:hypothetical protein